MCIFGHGSLPVLQFYKGTLFLFFVPYLRSCFGQVATSRESSNSNGDGELPRVLSQFEGICSELGGLNSEPAGSIPSSDDETNSAEQLARTFCRNLAEQAVRGSTFCEDLGRQDPIDRRLDQNCTPEVNEEALRDIEHLPWYASPNGPWAPVPQIALFVIFFAVVIFLWEVIVLRSTTCSEELALCCTPKKSSEVNQTEYDGEGAWGVAEVDAFWRNVERWAGGLSGNPASSRLVSQAQPVQYVRFSKLVYRVYTDDEYAVIGVIRTGHCQSTIKVKVKSLTPKHIYFAAKEGVEYEHVEEELVFAKGEKVKQVQVPIYGDHSWDAGTLFVLTIVEVSSATEVFAKGRDARILVIDSHRWPGDCPDTRDEVGTAHLVWAFFQECYYIRGPTKVIKTFIGILYKPFHFVLVSSLVAKYTIDWACSRDVKHPASNIVSLGMLQFVSTLIFRWSDQLQVQNRGRTGGIRQTHRRWLFDKMMFLGQTKHIDSKTMSGAEWFYAAVNDVNSLTLDLYWQVFRFVELVFSIFLTIAILIILNIKAKVTQGKAIEFNFLTPLVVLLLVIAMSQFVTQWKGPYIKEYQMARRRHEVSWLDYWSWLAHTNSLRYGFSFKEISAYEKRYTEINDAFVKDHQSIRDWMNDSAWWTKWMCNVASLIVMIWGAFALVSSRVKTNTGSSMTAGEYAVLMSIFARVGGYLIKLNEAQVCMVRGRVALRRIQKHLNMGFEDDDQYISYWEDSDCITLTGAHYCPDGLTAYQNMQMKPNSQISIVLGSFVWIASTDERALLTCLALMSGNLRPRAGNVSIPGHLAIVQGEEMPPQATGCMNVREEIQLTGACDDAQADRVARAFGLEPLMGSHHLLPADKKLLAVLKLMLIDLDVLILARPFAFVAEVRKPMFTMLMRCWQRCGGASGLLECISDAGLRSMPSEKLPWKTLVIFEPSFPGAHPDDVRIDLDEYLQSGSQAVMTAVPGRGSHAQPLSGSPHDHYIDGDTEDEEEESEEELDTLLVTPRG